MATTTKKLNIHQRLHACMKDVAYTQEEKGGQGMPYTFASHDAVTRECRRVFIEHGVFCQGSVVNRTQDGNRTEIDLEVTFTNLDDPEDRFSVMSCGYGIDNQDNGPGKAVNCAYTYALMTCLALEIGDGPESANQDHKPEG